MTPRHVRALRGTAAAWVATVVAATAHTLGGGGAPAPALVAAVGILAAPFAVALVGRRVSAWRIGATVLASQSLFHVAFAVTAGADPAALHGHHVTHLGEGLSAVVLPDAPMFAAHVLAAVATIAALYGGERMLRSLGRGIRSLFSRLRGVAPRPSLRRIAPAAAGPVLVAARTVLSDLSRRGPPAFV
ncbi:hypothetical protein ACFC1I_14170 [Microbacterium sp. NPDC056044]|uniref:hypothetical protein n=1 Tax=Microbacterium sp. NPDC056044 TaxID=3345690 RepID=UPI0035E26C0B